MYSNSRYDVTNIMFQKRCLFIVFKLIVLSDLYIVITAGMELVGCLEAFAPHCYVLVATLGVPVYLTLVCFNFIFSFL
jgi:hypothetical protein